MKIYTMKYVRVDEAVSEEIYSIICEILSDFRITTEYFTKSQLIDAIGTLSPKCTRALKKLKLPESTLLYIPLEG